VKPGWLSAFANGVLALSAADALFSLLDGVVRATTGVQWLALPRNALAEFALAAVMTSVPVMLVTPRLPASVFLPLAAVTLWLTLGAAPLALWVAPPLFDATGCAIQLTAVALAFAVVRARSRKTSGWRAWWFDAVGTDERPAFAWSHSLVFAAGLCSLGPLVALGYGVVAVATSIQLVTHGFVDFGLTGVSLADRHYQRGDREIRLVGMMHIGDPAAYRALTRTFARESTIVLAEGVSDREGRLASALQYGHAAQALGLAPQEDLSAYLVDAEDPEAEPPEWPVLRRADVDTSSFSPETMAMIRWAGEVWKAEDLASALRVILRGAREQGPEQRMAFFADVVDRRNEHLVGEIERALDEYERVIVPWGALHLPSVERTVLSWGFAETSRELRPLFAWRTVAAALWQMTRRNQ
jgi:hypothetical protein